jgi:hypothetical protein
VAKKFHQTKVGNAIAAVIGIAIAAVIVFVIIGK